MKEKDTRDSRISEAQAAANAVPLRVERIRICGLFGEFDYDLARPDSSEPNANLLILYGDNGTGKTTLLQLLFHALSAGAKRGHRTAISKIPFQSFDVFLRPDAHLCFFREPGAFTGAYTVRVSTGGKELTTVGFRVKDDQFDNPAAGEQLINFLASLNTKFYFLNAERDFESDATPRASRARAIREVRMHYLRAAELRARSMEQRDEKLNSILELCTTWITEQVITATNRGTEDSHKVYAQMLSAITKPYPNTPVETLDGRGLLIERLQKTAAEITEYSKLGFLPELSVDEMVHSIIAAPEHSLGAVQRLVDSYITGTRARLDALRAPYEKIVRLIELLNRFYSFKKVRYSLGRGFSFLAANSQEIRPSQLSSGEQHILTLFCLALISTSERSVFIIDEPELSLNVKWQRELLSSLLALSGTSQFIVATHAIELLTDHRAELVKLTPQMSMLAHDDTPTGSASDGETPNS